MLRTESLLHLSLLFVLGLCSVARAQDDAQAAGKGDGEEVDGTTGEVLTPDQRAKLLKSGELIKEVDPASVITGGLERYVQALASIEPVRIPPGGQGVMKIVLGLREGAVLASAADVAIEYGADQGVASLGAFVLGEPSIAKNSPALNGRPAYENYAIVTIPLAVKPNTEFGKYPLNAQVVAVVTEPIGGGRVGRFRGPVRAELVVGPAIPTPAVVPGAASGSAPDANDPPRVGSGSGQGAGSNSIAGSNGTRIEAAEPGHPKSVRNDADLARDSEAIGQEPSRIADNLLMWGAGGVLSIVVLALVISSLRKR